MQAFWIQHQLGICGFLLVLVIIALSNLRTLKRLGRAQAPARWPRVSILLPARNEELNIVEAVECLAGQDYQDFELVVLDDCSEDRTPEILNELSGKFDRLRVVHGRPLPDGWLGKLWACDQLSRTATGELLLFTDADTRHSPEALRQAVAQLEQDRLDLLTAIPLEQTEGWAEKLVVPVMARAIMAFLPLGLAYRWNRPAFTAANGQFMLFRRTSYDAIGGHQAVRDNIVDDLGLVRLIAKQGMRWRLFDAMDLVRCRMYRSTAEVFDGFSKNLFGTFEYRLLPFLFVWTWLGVVTLEPQVVLGLGALGSVTSTFSLFSAGAGSALGLMLWGISDLRFRFSWWVPLLYPVSMLLCVVIAFRSVFLTASRRTTWKGRNAVIRRVRLW